ncbi:hypothetical protein TNCV_884941 [Trichonephila clavipes]|nr:hypothetical protein TNCV_884941 [Trichonephila clavipes]
MWYNVSLGHPEVSSSTQRWNQVSEETDGLTSLSGSASTGNSTLSKGIYLRRAREHPSKEARLLAPAATHKHLITKFNPAARLRWGKDFVIVPKMSGNRSSGVTNRLISTSRMAVSELGV